MKTIHCLLVDDEKLALDVLELYIQKLDYLEIEGRCSSAEEASLFLEQHHVDLIFLDIQMPKCNGMEWMKSLENKPKVIFCTAFDRFAVESYDVDAVDYLLKPISFDRFQKAVQKAKDIIQKDQINDKTEEFINVRSDRKVYKIAINDILYIHSISNYYQIIMADRTSIAYGSLSSLENQLMASKFLRIQRSYIVAIDKIEAASGTSVIINKQVLPVGKHYREIVENLFRRTI